MQRGAQGRTAPCCACYAARGTGEGVSRAGMGECEGVAVRPAVEGVTV